MINRLGLRTSLIALFMATPACELLLLDPPAGTPVEVFEEAWRFADTHYSFFELKGVDWSDAYARYRPLVREDMDERELFNLLASMIEELRDGHVNLRSPFDLSRYWEWYLGHEANFDPVLLEREYYRGRQEYAGPFVLLDFVEENVGYARYASFADAVTEAHLDHLFQRFEHRDALILDVRSNGGGFGSNAHRIASRFVEEQTLRGYQVYKAGPGHEDFSEPRAVMVVPAARGALWDRPVVVLTNRSSYSATNLFAALMKDLPRATIIGDTTGGGGGTPAFTELSNGWLLRVSASRLFVHDWLGLEEWRNVEEGVDPDIEARMEDADAVRGRDTIIETALDFLTSGEVDG